MQKFPFVNAFPLLFGYFFQQLYSFVDAAVVGRYLGLELLAAVGSTGSLNFMILGFCMGICSGCSIPVAQSFGAKDESLLRRYVFNSIWVIAFIGGLMAVLTTLPRNNRCPQKSDGILAFYSEIR